MKGGFDQIAHLKALKVLDLGKNSIDFSLQQFYSFILKPIQKLPKLEYLSFQDNPIEVKIVKCKYLCIAELPKLKYYDWKLISKDDRTTAKNFEKQDKWKDKENKPEPLNAKSVQKPASVAINLPTAASNTPKQEDKSAEDKMSVVEDTKTKRLSELVGKNDSLVNFLLGNESDPINDIMGEMEGTKGDKDNFDPLAMYLQTEGGDSGADPLIEVIKYLEEQPEEESKPGEKENYEDELLKIIYGEGKKEEKTDDNYDIMAIVNESSARGDDDIFKLISDDMADETPAEKPKPVEVKEKPKEPEKASGASGETDLDELLSSIMGEEFGSQPSESTTSTLDDIDEIIKNSSSVNVAVNAEEDDGFSQLLEGALEKKHEQEKKVEEERMTIERGKEDGIFYSFTILSHFCRNASVSS